MAFIKKDWLFTITKTVLKRGTRFKNGDKPNEQTFKNWVQSSVFKTEPEDRAKINDVSKTLEEVAGHVALASDEEAKTNAFQPDGRSLAAQPSQITTARGVEGNDLILSLDTIGNDNKLGDPIVFEGTAIEVKDEGTTRNDYLISLKESFRTFISSIVSTINAISLKLVSVIEQAETNRLNIVDLKSLDGDVDAFINGLNPKGTIIASVLGVGMDPEFWYKMDGGARLSKYIDDDINEGPTAAWSLFQNLDIIVDDGNLLFGFKNIGAPVFDSGLGLGQQVTSNKDWKATFTQTDIPKHDHEDSFTIQEAGSHTHKFTKSGDNNLDNSGFYPLLRQNGDVSLAGYSDVAQSAGLKSAGNHFHAINGKVDFYGNESVTYPSVNVPRVGVHYYIKIQ